MATKEQIKNLKYVFNPKSIAVIGASPTPNKVSNVILKALLEGGFQGPIYPVNPRYGEVANLACYPDLRDIKKPVDCVIIATPAQTVPEIIKTCAALKIRGVITVSAGFGEAGEEGKKLEEEVRILCNKNNIAMIGANCLGVYNPTTRVDSIFLPIYKLERPNPGTISFITQSGAIGSTIVDLAAFNGIGIAKFVSYGNATVIDECDLLTYLESDRATKTIVMYIEGAKRGRQMYETLRRVNRKKPVIALKAGKFEKSADAAKSHTGNVAGAYAAYQAAFRQAKVVEADGIEDLFDFMKIFSQPFPKGKKIAVITNGGGMGVLTADEIERQGLEFAVFSDASKAELKKILPDFGNVNNPLDLIAEADATKYERALALLINDPGVDAIIVITLFQTPPMDERVLNVLAKVNDERKKPLAVVCLGGSYTENYQRHLNKYGVPVYASPTDAVRAMKKLIEYAAYRKNI